MPLGFLVPGDGNHFAKRLGYSDFSSSKNWLYITLKASASTFVPTKANNISQREYSGIKAKSLFVRAGAFLAK